jgi:mycothione reductase
VNKYIAGVDPGYQGNVESSGATLIRGEGRFTGPKSIAVAGREISAQNIVIATGSRPKLPPFPDLPVWTSNDLFPLDSEPPKSLLVIGGGFIGCEMSAFFAAVGTKTTLFSRGGKLLAREDADIERVFQAEFERYVSTYCHATLQDLKWDGNEFTATFDIHGDPQTFTAERLLFAIGRIPNTDMLDLSKTGLESNERGFLEVNESLETAVPGIYATGDVNGRYMLQHAASFEVQYLGQRLLKGETDLIDERPVGHAVFSYPEVASVGLTEEQLKKEGTPFVAIFTDWLTCGRAVAMRIDYPRTKLLVSPTDYSILGCHLVGPESAILLHQVLTVMRLKNDVRELANMIFIHPALNECLLAAAVMAEGEVQNFQP